MSASMEHKEVRKEDMKEVKNKTVLFVEYTEGGELVDRLNELIMRLTPALGFGFKVTERAGTNLQNSFPLTTLWRAVCKRRGVYYVLPGDREDY